MPVEELASASRELGMARTDVRCAIKIASIAPGILQAVKGTKLGPAHLLDKLAKLPPREPPCKIVIGCACNGHRWQRQGAGDRGRPGPPPDNKDIRKGASMVSWFVPPIVVPVLLGALVVVYALYRAHM